MQGSQYTRGTEQRRVATRSQKGPHPPHQALTTCDGPNSKGGHGAFIAPHHSGTGHRLTPDRMWAGFRLMAWFWAGPICTVLHPCLSSWDQCLPLSWGSSSSKIWDLSSGKTYERQMDGMSYRFYHCRWSWGCSWDPVSPSPLPHLRVSLAFTSTSANPDGLLGEVTQTLRGGSEPLITMCFSGHSYCTCHLSSKLNKRTARDAQGEYLIMTESEEVLKKKTKTHRWGSVIGTQEPMERATQGQIWNSLRQINSTELQPRV